MDYFKLVAVLFSATGFWKLTELVLRFRTDKKKQLIEIESLRAQADSQIIGNWIQWAQKLEKRIKELEDVASENRGLKIQIDQQRSQIAELEGKVKVLEKENQQLKVSLDNHTAQQ